MAVDRCGKLVGMFIVVREVVVMSCSGLVLTWLVYLPKGPTLQSCG